MGGDAGGGISGRGAAVVVDAVTAAEAEDKRRWQRGDGGVERGEQ